MFFYGLLERFCQKIKIEMSFFTDILLSEQVKKLIYSVNESAHFLPDIGLAHFSFASFPPVSHKKTLHSIYIRFSH